MTLKALKPSLKLIEQYEILRCRALSLINGKSEQSVVLAFTSCKSGEGVSSVAANFAATLAGDKQRRVLLMDGDLRRPSLHRMMPKRELKGIAATPAEASREPVIAEGYGAPSRDELTEPAWRLLHVGENLDVLLARRKVDYPGQLFAMREFGEFLAHAKQRYDFVILDCPPIYGSSGSTILSSKSDGVVLVVESGKVRRQVVRRGVELLEETGAHVLGVVLNKRRYPIPKIFYEML